MRRFAAALSIGLSFAPCAFAKDYCHRSDETTLGSHKCYVNHSGDDVHSPAPAAQQPVGATALCRIEQEQTRRKTGW